MLIISSWLMHEVRGAEETVPDYLTKVVEDLVKHMGDDNYEVREKATEALIALGPQIKPRIEKALTSTDPEVQLRARQIMFALKWEAAFLKRTGKFIAEVRHGNIKDTALFQQVLQFLSTDESAYMLLDLLRDSQQTLESRRRIAETLRNTYNLNLKPLLADLLELYKAEKDQVIKSHLMQSLARAGRDERLATVLLEDLQSSDYNTRINAISVIGQVREENVLPVLLKLAHDPDQNVRNTVTQALNNFRTAPVFEELLKVFKEEKVNWLKSQLIQMLAGFGDKKLLSELSELVKTEKDTQMLRNTAYAMNNFRGTPEASQILITLLKGNDVGVRSAALDVQRSLQDKTAVPEIIKLLAAENDFDAFNNLLGSLQGLSGQRFTPKEIPRELKDLILKTATAWWEKNK